MPSPSPAMMRMRRLPLRKRLKCSVTPAASIATRPGMLRCRGAIVALDPEICKNSIEFFPRFRPLSIANYFPSTEKTSSTFPGMPPH